MTCWLGGGAKKAHWEAVVKVEGAGKCGNLWFKVVAVLLNIGWCLLEGCIGVC